MALEDDINQLRQTALSENREPVQPSYQGVNKQRIAEVLQVIDRNTADQCDAVFALLDDEHNSWFKRAPAGTKFCDGASTAHIACHIGILQRGERKLDREGRDYWLKPLWELAGIEKVFFDSNTRQFIAGHPIAKSSNTAYRLAEDFKNILKAPDERWRSLLADWIQEDKVRQRLELQAELAEEARKRTDTKHSDLIKISCEYYAPKFLPDYQVLYVDDGDGDRVNEVEQKQLEQADIQIGLDDAMPDVLLWNPKTNHLWVIEAVTSDGEVDLHKVASLTALAERSGKTGINFTTTYQTWAAAAKRQSKQKNIAPGTYIWIQEDPSKHFIAETFNT